MSKIKSDRHYSPGKRDKQEWQVFNRFRRTIGENALDIDEIIDIIIDGDDPVVFGTGTPNYVTKWITAHVLGDAITYDTGERWGVGTEGPSDILTIEGGNAHTFWLERNHYPESPGKDFTIQAGGTTDDMVKTAVLASGGSGYIVGDLVYIYGHRGGLSAIVSVDSITSPYGIQTVVISNGGSGYTDGDYDFDVAGGTGGVINCTVVGGVVTTINSIEEIGEGYSVSTDNEISFDTSVGTGATVDITAVNGSVATFTITYKGSRYVVGVHATSSNSSYGTGCTIDVTEVEDTLDGDGGILILKPGITTGTGDAEIQIWTAPPGESGRIDNVMEQRAVITALGYWGLNLTDPLSWSDIDGSIGNTIETYTNTSLDLDITHFSILADASSNSVTIWLPDASTCERRRYRVKCIGLGLAYNLFVKSYGGNIEDKGPSVGIEYKEIYEMYEFHSDGVQWWIMGMAEGEKLMVFKYVKKILLDEEYPVPPDWLDDIIEADSYKDILYFHQGTGILIEMDADNDAVKFSTTIEQAYGFETIQIIADSGFTWDDTSVVADAVNDTLSLIPDTGITITADAELDAIKIGLDPDTVSTLAFKYVRKVLLDEEYPTPPDWLADVIVADSATDTLYFHQGAGILIEMDADNDSVKITNNAVLVAFKTINIDTTDGEGEYVWADYSVEADAKDDTLTFVQGIGISIIADADLDAIRISVDNTSVSQFAFKTITNEDQYFYAYPDYRLWSDTEVVADASDDTLAIIAGEGINILMDALNDVIKIEADISSIESTILSHNYFYDFWSVLSCDYTADPERIVRFGRLYNIFSLVGLTGKSIAPTGWHLPTNVEWKTLRDTIEPACDPEDNTVGLKMKLDEEWAWLNIIGTNIVGWNGVGGGHAAISGDYWEINVYEKLGSVCTYWSSTKGWDNPELPGHSAYYCSILSNNNGIFYVYGSGGLGAGYYSNTGMISFKGLSVRFIKDDSTDPGSVTDYDGNVYDTVKIGDQVWMAQDFIGRTYSDASTIPILEIHDNWYITTAACFDYADNEYNSFDILPATGEEYRIDPHDKIMFCGGVGIDILMEEVDDLLTITISSIEDITFEYRDVELGESNIYYLDPDASWDYTIIGYSFRVDTGSLGNVYLKNNGSTTIAGPLTVTTSLSESTLDYDVAKDDVITLEFDGTGADATEIRGKIRIHKK